MSSPSPAPGATVLLTCGSVVAHVVGGRHVDVGPRPGRAEIDPLLSDPDDPVARLVVAGTDADLAAVLLRLLRRERLDVALALLPAAGSEAAAVWGVPTDASAVGLALEGTPRPVPLVRDDGGGVLAGAARVGEFHGEVYCDERLVHRGDAAGLVVRPDPSGGVAVTVDGRRRLGGLRRGGRSSERGRATQIGCRPARTERDGVVDDRPLRRRSWYRHVEDWHLVLP